MRKTLVGALAVAASLFVAACGGDDSAEQSAAQGGGGACEPTTLTVGILPIVETAPLTIAQQQGFFEEENLTVKTEMAPGGAAIIPAVLGGSQQIGWGNTPSTLIASARGLPVRVIAPGGTTGVGEEDVSAIVTGKGSDIRTPADVEGKSVAVPTLNSLAEYAVRAALQEEGVDHTKVEFIEVPFPDMAAALESGDVAAAFVVEPFRTIAAGAGTRTLLQPYTTISDKPFENTQWITSEKFLQEDRAAVGCFVRAITKANEYAAENPDDARAALLEYTEIPKPITEKIRLPGWSGELDRPSYEFLAEITGEYGDLAKEPNLDELLVTDAAE